MHIPSTMLSGAVCPVTWAVSVVGVGAAARATKTSQTKPSAARFAAVTALIFGLQMLNYPVQSGTSGHLVGGLLAVALLGIPFAVLSMTIVLAVQAFFFGDGGINALGANVLNMALIGAGLLGFMYESMKKRGLNDNISLAGASFLAVLAAAFACSLEVAASGAVAINKVLPAMMSVHAFIGLGEALLTVAVVALVRAYAHAWKKNEASIAVGATILALIAAFLSPLASGFPDGLEWVAEKLSFIEFSASRFSALFADYQVALVSNEAAATVLAGLVGIAISFGLTFIIGQALKGQSATTA